MSTANPDIFTNFTPATDEVANLIRNRRTIHDFKADLPPRELILQAIELARWAPNHKLTNPWRFRLIGEKTQAGIVELNTQIVRETKGDTAASIKFERWSSVPGWLVVSSVKSSDPLRNRENYASVCCGIQNLSLFLWNSGVGVKWITGPVTRHIDFYTLLGIDPDIEDVVGIVWYGIPARTPEMKRGELSESVILLP